jgi:glycosyltransferase involved in cell wall biosynthesis
MSCCQAQDILYVILPYFNFCAFKRRRELFVQFVNDFRHEKNIRIVVAECIGPCPLPKLPVWSHLKFRTEDHFWIKENLINMAIRPLGSWKYVAWIDADIQFLNQNWVQETIDELQTADIVQMFQTAVNLGPNGEAIKTDKSFGYMAKGSGTPWSPADKYGFWHPGYAWACTRQAWLKMDSLIDWAILGSGDRHMAMALIGRATDSCPGNVHENYKKLLSEYQKNVSTLRLSWVDGTILHFWHGSFENRKYRERWDILVNNSYDPFADVGMDAKGQLHLTKVGKRLEPFLYKYFLGRSEDS